MLNDSADVTLDLSLPDVAILRWHASGNFFIHSLYEWLSFGGVINHEFTII
jgi:hypothetical protein